MQSVTENNPKKDYLCSDNYFTLKPQKDENVL